ncbi:ATP-binding protein [Xylanivirga thermophila]|uniref:ATP-binding protein n=1 Tax=Xylanivirga thermophila TaxID=2496273 RepID=UPI00101B7507|nr:ATP-binding protein [Xylanivirga thermophila]
MKKVLGCLRKTVQDFNMIDEGDRIAVGISGGKDSLTLLKALRLYQYFSPVSYELEAVTLTMGFDDFDLTEVETFCNELDIRYTIKHTQIGRIVFDVRHEKNPCSLCAKMRRGALHNAALELGCNKVALGHHREDVIETLLLSLFYEGRFNTFAPVTYLSRKDLTVIRPLVYASEADIKRVAQKHNLPVVKSPCPANGITKRQDMKDMMRYLNQEIPNSSEQILSALLNSKNINLWEKA